MSDELARDGRSALQQLIYEAARDANARETVCASGILPLIPPEFPESTVLAQIEEMRRAGDPAETMALETRLLSLPVSMGGRALVVWHEAELRAPSFDLPWYLREALRCVSKLDAADGFQKVAEMSANGSEPDEIIKAAREVLQRLERSTTTPVVPDLAALLSAPEEPARPCVKDLLGFGNASLMSGMAGTWKTTAAISAALHVASGGRFADHFDTFQAPVLHVDGELGLSKSLALYRRLGQGEAIDVADLARRQFLTYLPATGTGAGRDPKVWAQIVRERLVGLVILDPVVALYCGDEIDNSAIRSWWESAIRPLLDLGAAVLLLHHDRKGSPLAIDSPANATRGGGDWRGAPDLHGSIRREAGDRHLVRVEITKSRMGYEPEPFYLRVEDHDGGIRVRWAGEAQNAVGKAIACADAIDALLDRAGDGGMPRPAIIDALSATYAKRTIEDALSLVKERKSADTRRFGKETVYRRLRA